MLERDLEFSYLRKGYPMIQTSRRTLREVSCRVDPFLFDRLEDDSGALALREAYHVASTHPRDACNRLTEWSRDERRGYLPLEDVAAQIWLIASRA